MKTLNIISDQTAEVQLTVQELIMIKNAANQVLQRFCEIELGARVGVSPEQMKEFSEFIEKLIQEGR